MVSAGITFCFSVRCPSPLLLLLLPLLLPSLGIAGSWNGPSSVSLPGVWSAGSPYDHVLTRADPVGIKISIKIVLYRQSLGPSFFYGFKCYFESQCYFGLFIFQLNEDMDPVAVWSGNHGKLINNTTRLQLSEEGDLVLQDDDGTKIWSTDPVGKPNSAAGLNLTEEGNVVLYDRRKAVIWQSFEDPADCLLPRQVLRLGMKLTKPGPEGKALIYTFSVEDHLGFVASLTTSSSLQTYYRTSNVSKMTSNNGQVVANYTNESFGEFHLLATPLAQFIMLESDGHLRRYVYAGNNNWTKEDLLIGSQVNEISFGHEAEIG